MRPAIILKPENTDFATGRSAKLPGTSKAILFIIWILPALLAMVTLIGGLITHRSWSTWEALDSQGKEVTGIITRVKLIHSKTRHYYYEFPVDDSLFQGVYRAKSGRILALENASNTVEGDEVSVTYLPTDPHVSQLTQLKSGPTDLVVITGILGLVALAFGLAAYQLTFSGRKRLKTLKKVDGKIEKIDTLPTPEGNTPQALLTYSFISPLSGKSLTRDYKFYGVLPNPLPETGQPVIVAYVHDNDNWLL